MFLILLLFCFVNDSVLQTMEGRIHKGSEVGIHQYSYAVFIHFETTRHSSCGASLIMVQALITAAHCVDELTYKRGTISAFFGATVPNDAEVVRTVIDAIIHPRYVERKGKSNVAVLFLDARVPLMHEIKKVPLAAEDPGVDVKAVAASWGKQEYGKLPDFSYYRSLRSTKQLIISGKECAQHIKLSMSPKVMCTKPIRGHFATDDSGVGLVVTKPSHTLVGVLSFVENDIGFYTNVYAERDWIIKSCFDLYRRNCPYGKIRRRKVPFV